MNFPRPGRWQLSLVAICFVFGVLLAWAFGAQGLARTQKKENELVKIVEQVEAETVALEAKIEALRTEIKATQEEQTGKTTNLNLLQQELQNLQAQAGLTPLKGKGIVVTLEDNQAGAAAAQKSNPALYQPENYIIHDKDILYLVYELKAAGAKAIAVNNQRVITTTDIRCIGPVIMVNSTRLAPPYEIKALGDPEALTPAINNGEEFAYLKSRGFPFKIVPAEELALPPYKGSREFRYVKTIPSET